MAKKGTTRELILDLGEEFLRSRGYHAFSYHDIAAKLNIKNAAIHYHFPLKEDLGTAIIKRSMDKFELLRNDKKFKQLDEMGKLSCFMEEIFGRYLTDNRVCLVGALSTEYPVLPEMVQEEFQRMTNSIRHWLTELLKEGKKNGHFSFMPTAEAKALMIISNLMAGLQIARFMHKKDFKLIKDGILKELKNEEKA